MVPPQPGVMPTSTSGIPQTARSRRNHEVAGHRDLEPAADSEAVDRGDRDLVELLEGVGHRLVDVDSAHDPVGIPPSVHLGDVVAGAERLAGSVDHRHLEGRGAPNAIYRSDQLVAEGNREGVPLLGSIERDPRDGAVLGVVEKFEIGRGVVGVVHGGSSSIAQLVSQ